MDNGLDGITYIIKKEPEYLDSIDRFFRFLNHPRYYSDSDLVGLDNLNKSDLAKLMFQHLGGWDFDFYHCEPNSDTFIIRRTEETYSCHFELCPVYAYDSQSLRRYISYYNYEYYSSTKAGNPNEKKVISAREGLDLIELMRLSFLAMIHNYEKEHGSNIRCFNGWYNFRENLIDYCVQNKLI